MKRKIALLVAIVMVLTMMPFTVAAAGYTDLEKHWAAEYINKWSLGDKPVLVGYGDTFGPENQMKTKDLELITDRILGKTGNVWVDSPVITREQAVNKMAQELGVEPKTVITQAERFADHAEISADCAPYIYALKSRGLISGMGGNTFAPKTAYTRAQAVTVIYNMVGSIIDSNADITQSVYNQAVVVRASGITFKDTTFESDLVIGYGVGDGEVFLENVNVNGNLVVFGGGMNSVHITGNSRINKITGAKRMGQSANIHIEETSSVSSVAVEDNANIIITGDVDVITVGAGATVEIAEGASVGNVALLGASSQLVVNDGAAVDTVSVSANGAEIAGGGEVNNVSVAASVTEPTTVSTSNTRVNNEGSASVVDSSGRTIANSGGSSRTNSGGNATGGGGSGVSGGNSSPGGSSGGGSNNNNSGGNAVTNLSTVTAVIDVPVADAVPAREFAVLSNANYTAGAITWEPADETFRLGVEYTAMVTVHTKTGYAFTANTVPNVLNGNPVITKVSQNANSLTYTAKFGPAELAATVIKSVTISNPDPKAYDVLSAVIDPANAEVSYKWSVDGAVKSEGATYTVSPDDVGNTVSLTVTGVAPYTGSAADETNAVAAGGSKVSAVEQTKEGSAAVAEVKGVWTLEIETAFSASDKLKINNVDYTCVASDPSDNQFVPGAGASAQAAALAALLDAGLTDFDVTAEGAVIKFTQKVGGTGAAPTAEAIPFGQGTGAVGEVANPTQGVAADAGTKGTYTVTITTAFIAGDSITVNGTTYTCVAESANTENNEFVVGAGENAQATALAALLNADLTDFDVMASGAVITFTQVTPKAGTDDKPVISVAKKQGGTGDAELADGVAGKAAVVETLGVYKVTISTELEAGDKIKFTVTTDAVQPTVYEYELVSEEPGAGEFTGNSIADQITALASKLNADFGDTIPITVTSESSTTLVFTQEAGSGHPTENVLTKAELTTVPGGTGAIEDDEVKVGTPGVVAKPAVKSVWTLTITEAFAADETITIGEDTYTAKTSPAGDSKTEFAVGSNAADQATALLTLLNNGDAQNSLASDYTIATGGSGIITFTQKNASDDSGDDDKPEVTETGDTGAITFENSTPYKAAVDEVFGTYTVKITNALSVGDSITIFENAYTCAASNAGAGQFVGTTAAAQATAIVSLVTGEADYNDEAFTVKVSEDNGATILFTQKVAATGTDDKPTVTVDNASGSQGDLAEGTNGVTVTTPGVAAAAGVKGTFTLTVKGLFTDGDTIKVGTTTLTASDAEPGANEFAASTDSNTSSVTLATQALAIAALLDGASGGDNDIFGDFDLSVQGAVITFTQTVAGTGAKDALTLTVTRFGEGKAAIGEVTNGTSGKDPVTEVKGIYEVEITEIISDGGTINIKSGAIDETYTAVADDESAGEFLVGASISAQVTNIVTTMGSDFNAAFTVAASGNKIKFTQVTGKAGTDDKPTVEVVKFATGTGAVSEVTQTLEGKAAADAVKGTYAFTINVLLAEGDKITVAGTDYTMGTEITGGTITEQAASLAGAVNTKYDGSTFTVASDGATVIFTQVTGADGEGDKPAVSFTAAEPAQEP